MKIAFIVDIINEKSGARAPIKIALGLAGLGEQITMISYSQGKDPDVEEKLKKAGITIIYLEVPPSRIGKYFTAFKVIKPLMLVKPDIIACHSSYPLFFAAKLVRKPIIYTYYGTQLTGFNVATENETGLYSSSLKKFQFLLADKIITLFESWRVKLSERVLGISQSTVREVERLYHKKIDFIYLGAEIDTNSSNPVKKYPGEHLLLSVSRITPYKGFHRVLKAFNKLKGRFPHVSLVLIGSSYDQEYLDLLKKLSDSRIRVILSPNDSVLLGYYNNCDIYLSGTTWEGFGLPFLEAQKLGKPVLGFRNTSIPEVVNDGKSGLLATSQEEFEKNLERLLSDKNLREIMGREGIIFAGKFNWEKTALDYQKYFREYLKGKL